MRKTIKTEINGYRAEYVLDDTGNGITVSAPCIDENEEGEPAIGTTVFTIGVSPESNQKIGMVNQFFDEESTVITRGGIGYNLIDVLTDEADLPDDFEPEVEEAG